MISTELNGRFQYLKSQFSSKDATSGSANFRSVECALETVFRCESDPARKEIVERVAIKYFQTNNPAVCTELDPESLKMFKDLRDWIKFFKFGFIKLTNDIKSYHKYDDSNIMDYLIQIQAQIDFQNIVENYRQALMAIRNRFSWTEEFVNQWVEQSKYMKENDIELFRKKEQPKETTPAPKKTPKRSAPSKSDAKTETGSQAGEAPVKKLKKDSVNYRAIVLAIEKILEISSGQQREILQQRFSEFKQTDNLQYLQLLDQETAKRIFEMRSFMKLFLDAITEATMNPQYSQFADKDLLEKIFSLQGQIDPDNVFESYKTFLEKNQSNLGWPRQMIHGVLRRVIEFKRIETQYLLNR